MTYGNHQIHCGIKLVWLWRNNYSSHFFVVFFFQAVDTAHIHMSIDRKHALWPHNTNSWSHLFKTVIILSAYPGSGRREWDFLHRYNSMSPVALLASSTQSLFLCRYIILYIIENVKIMKLIMWRTIRRRYIHSQYPVKWTRNSVWITK